jgi:hypothetical protein
MARFASTDGGLMPMPSRDFVPAADLLSCARKKVGKESAPVPSPLRCAKGSPAMLEAQGRAELTSLRCVQTGGAKSVLEARCARALGSCASRLLQRGTPNTNAKPRSRLTPAVGYAPFSTAEERKVLKPRAQHASTSDSAQLFEQSVAARVLRGASRPEYRREPAASLRAVRSGGALCLLSGGPESRSPAGAKSRHGTRQQHIASTERPPCL